MAYRHHNSGGSRDNRRYGGGGGGRGRRRHFDFDGAASMMNENDGSSHVNFRPPSDYFLSKFANRRYDSASSGEEWFRVVIPGVCGPEAGKSQISSMLNDRSSVPLTMYHFCNDESNTRVVFYVSSRSEAFELRTISRRFSFANRSASIYVQRVSEPSFALNGEILDVLKRWIASRYSAETGILALGGVSRNDDLKSEGIYLNLSRTSCLTLVVNICEEMFPNATILDLRENHINALDPLRQRLCHITRLNLESNSIHRIRELEFVRHMHLVELSIGDNPICRQFTNFEDLTSAIRERCPKLIILNGSNLPPKIGFAVDDEPVTLPASVNFNVPDQYKEPIASFINDYFTCFDASPEQRQSLMSVYTDDAILSFSVAWSASIRPHHRFDRYSKEGRNFVKVVDEVGRFDRLKRGRLDVIAFLAKFPRTKHEITSLKVDLFALTPHRLSFAISGVLAEDNSDLAAVPEKFRCQYRQFFRVFHCRPGQDSGFKIHAEHFSIAEATSTQAKNAKLQMGAGGAFSNSAADTPVPGQTSEMTKLIDQMVAATGMKIEFAKECLNANNWVFDNALRNYLELKSNNLIPEDAFDVKREK